MIILYPTHFPTTCCNIHNHRYYFQFVFLSLDNQEVYQDCNEETGAVLVIEILEYETTVKDDGACVYFMQDLDIRPGIITRPDDYNSIDENEEFRYPQKQPAVIDLVYNDSTYRNYWLTNLKLPTRSYEYNDDDEYDANVSFIRNNYKGLFVACLGRGHRMDETHCVDIEMCVLRFKSMKTDMLITLTTPIISDRVEEAAIEDDDDPNTSVSMFRQILKTFNITDWNLLGMTTDNATQEYIN